MLTIWHTKLCHYQVLCTLYGSYHDTRTEKHSRRHYQWVLLHKTLRERKSMYVIYQAREMVTCFIRFPVRPLPIKPQFHHIYTNVIPSCKYLQTARYMQRLRSTECWSPLIVFQEPIEPKSYETSGTIVIKILGYWNFNLNVWNVVETFPRKILWCK